MTDRTITIDGPAGSGKSTTAKAVAERLGFMHLDSGALYRAITLAALDRGTMLSGSLLVSLANTLPVRLAHIRNAFVPEIAGVDVSGAVRTDRVTQRVSEVAAIPAVREWAGKELRRAVELAVDGVVAEGRDMGTVVFPKAALKVFLTASPAARAKRRALQDGLATDHEVLDRLREQLIRRDEADSSREVAPLAQPDDAVVVDTTDLTFAEQVDEVVKFAQDRLATA